ncbi:MAG: hypothetical protein IJ770_03655 [Alphaproteobacteria bacterium]|nr:hypothetical protein [Alphaproteobacteria bacterium]
MFENIYQHALKLDELMNQAMATSDFSLLESSEFIAAQAAHSATLNERLTRTFNNEQIDFGNAKIVSTANFNAISQYTDAFPDLAQNMEKNYSAVVAQAAADIAAFLPKGTKLEEYLPVIKEHPKAVLALAITAKANQEAKIPTTIDSPEDLFKKSQHPAIVALSEKISFNDLQGSMKTIHQAAQPVIGLGRENINTPTISRAKVNEG